ncbi:C-X-C motif chemokine 13 [Castor canadensis]|uniref:C-X-C motif chemokine n=2 Tax=Castor canadensis TaxID=51338 RepID=A0A8C0XV31_CASCN
MRLSVPASLFILLVCSLPPVHGVLEAYNTNLKCRCIQETSDFIPLSLIEWIQVIRPGNGCPNKEIIIWTKKKFPICLNPQTKWVQKVIQLLQRRYILSTPPAPVYKRKTS